jgi:hypothetical protein
MFPLDLFESDIIEPNAVTQNGAFSLSKNYIGVQEKNQQQIAN